MSSVLSTAVTGLNDAVSRATQSARNIANGSLTDKNTDKDLVDLTVAKNDYAANAKVIQTNDQMQKRLLDIVA